MCKKTVYESSQDMLTALSQHNCEKKQLCCDNEPQKLMLGFKCDTCQEQFRLYARHLNNNPTEILEIALTTPEGRSVIAQTMSALDSSLYS